MAVTGDVVLVCLSLEVIGLVVPISVLIVGVRSLLERRTFFESALCWSIVAPLGAGMGSCIFLITGMKRSLSLSRAISVYSKARPRK